jgi:Transcriptional regulators
METDAEENATQLIGVFRRLQRLMHIEMFRNIQSGQKPSQLFVLMRLKKSLRKGEDGMRVSVLASGMGISVPAVTQIVSNLEKDGYVKREMDPADRRAVLVHLTPSGEQMMEPAQRRLETAFGGLIDHLGTEKTETLVELLLETENYFTDVTGDMSSPDCPAC